MKIIQLVFGILVIGLLTFVAFNSKGGVINFGSGIDTVSFYTDATNSSSSVLATATTTNPILSLNMGRTNAIVCNNSANVVFLHQKGQATTTGVVVNEGIPIYPTSTAGAQCQSFPGLKGYLFGIASATSSVTVSEWK